MASTHKHIRSSTANKRPTTAIADGQLALNTNSASPGLFFKDSTGATIIKIGPVHVGATAPNASPAAGGSAGNSTGEIWLDNSLTPVGVKIWNGSAWVNATPIGSTTVQGLLELATDAETQAGSDNARAVTPASLQSKVSDSTSTTSSTTIASSTAVKAAYDLANAALPKTGGTVTGNLEIGTTGSLSFEGSTADGFETTIAVVDPTADRTITLPNTTGTVVTTGDTGTVTSTMLADGTIVDADISATAEIAVSKLADGTARQLLQTDAAGTGVEWTSDIDIPGTLDVTGAAAFDSSVAVTGALTKSGSNVVTVGDTGTVTSTMIANDTIVNADINSAAAIAGTKISPDFGSQTITTSGLFSHALGTAGAPTITFTGDTNTGIYSPGADQVAISTGGSGRLFVDASGNVGAGTSSPAFAAGGGIQAKYATFSSFRATVGANTGTDFSAASDGKGYIYVRDNADLLIGTNNTERLRITSAGLVGVGTSSPQSQLQVLDQVRISNSSQSEGSIVLGDGGSTLFNVGLARWNGGSNTAGAGGIGYFSQGTANIGGHYFYTGDAVAGSQTARMAITPAGNIGIGTTPTSIFHVKAATNRNFKIDSAGGGGGDLRISALNDADSANVNLQLQGDQLFFAAGGAERARIDSSGRLLVGTSNYTGNSKFVVAGLIGGDVGLLDLRYTGSRPTVADITVSEIRFGSSDLTANTAYARIIAESDGASSSGSDIPGRLVFSTTADGASSPTERMRITSSGALKASTNGTYKFDAGVNEIAHNDTNSTIHLIASNTSFTGDAVTISTYRNTSDSTYNFLSCIRQNFSIVLYIRDSGNIVNANNSYGAISDLKLKENIVDASSQWSDIKALQVRKYNFKEGQTHTQIGLVAQEVELVSPGLVSKSSDRDAEGNDLGTVTKSVNYSVLYMKAVKALQEAMERIETLEASNADLLVRVSALESKP